MFFSSCLHFWESHLPVGLDGNPDKLSIVSTWDPIMEKTVECISYCFSKELLEGVAGSCKIGVFKTNIHQCIQNRESFKHYGNEENGHNKSSINGGDLNWGF